MVITQEAIQKFKTLPVEVILEFNHPNIIGRLKALEQQFGVELSPVMIMIAIDEMSYDEITGYLQNEYRLGFDTADMIRKKLEEEVLNPLHKRLQFIDPAKMKPDFSLAQEKEMILDIMGKKLILELGNYPPLLDATNKRIFFILSQDMKFKESMEKALLGNHELISMKELAINGKLLSANVTNWIRLFLNSVGDDDFDSVKISRFVTSSAPARELNEREKTYLFKVLKTFYYIKYFPESMPTDDGTGWEILPVDELEPGAKKTLGVPMTDDEKQINELKEFGEKYSVRKLEKLAIEEEINAKRKIEDLRALANRYKDGSLEKRAIEEEIRKLSF